MIRKENFNKHTFELIHIIQKSDGYFEVVVYDSFLKEFYLLELDEHLMIERAFDFIDEGLTERLEKLFMDNSHLFFLNFEDGEDD